MLRRLCSIYRICFEQIFSYQICARFVSQSCSKVSNKITWLTPFQTLIIYLLGELWFLSICLSWATSHNFLSEVIRGYKKKSWSIACITWPSETANDALHKRHYKLLWLRTLVTKRVAPISISFLSNKNSYTCRCPREYCFSFLKFSHLRMIYHAVVYSSVSSITCTLKVFPFTVYSWTDSTSWICSIWTSTFVSFGLLDRWTCS